MTADSGDLGSGLEDLDVSDEPDDAELPDIGEGRYLYCVVRAGDDPDFETSGVDDESVSVVGADGIGAVVLACDGIYDSAALTEVRRWLVRHQTVVDEAGDTFGTPIPFQFDTILRGDDDDVRKWVREESQTLERALAELTGHWEYRVEVVETEQIDEEALLERDDRLRELDEKIAYAGEWQKFLLEKQYEQRATKLRLARRESLADYLHERLVDVVREVHALEVRFNGPWPPYTFAPELGNEDT